MAFTFVTPIRFTRQERLAIIRESMATTSHATDVLPKSPTEWASVWEALGGWWLIWGWTIYSPVDEVFLFWSITKATRHGLSHFNQPTRLIWIALRSSDLGYISNYCPNIGPSASAVILATVPSTPIFVYQGVAGLRLAPAKHSVTLFGKTRYWWSPCFRRCIAVIAPVEAAVENSLKYGELISGYI